MGAPVGSSRTIYTGGDADLHLQTNTGDVKILSGLGANSLMVLKATGNVGIGTTSPQVKLHVDGAIKVGTAQTLAASSTTVGAIRYRAGGNDSYMEMVMQTGVSGVIPVYAWVIIKQNTW